MALDVSTDLPAAATPRSALRAPLQLLRRVLPRGRLLPDAMWARRHRLLVLLLWAHAALLAPFALANGFGPATAALGAGALAGAARLAACPRLSRRLCSVVASLGLVASSALIVAFAHGQAEAYFHFFIVLSLLTLYQDWLPFLAAVVLIALHHVVLGVLAPETVFDVDAQQHPVRWALVHAGFLVAASLANVVAWRGSEQLLRDTLTGLPTRLLFLDRLTMALEQSRRSGRPLAVLFLDLDRFKVINDSLGHRAGDRLLVEVARRLQAAMRPYDTAARFGGDEFAILCPDVGGEAQAVAIAERLARVVARPLGVDEAELYSTVSIGITLPDLTHESAEDVLRDADAAMYQAKRAGGDGCAVFDLEMRARAVERLETENALRAALERDEFRVHYQLEADLETGEFVGVEALLRWQHPERGMVAPGSFIALAEETGLIVPLGAWMLEEACRQTQRWRRSGRALGSLLLRVNISATQFREPGLVGLVRDVLERTETDPSQLCLEITEGVVMEDTAQTMEVLSQLKALGVTLAVDDFGTGYSSLNYLRRFPVDALKVDRSFVAGLGEEPHSSAIVAAVVSVAHALGLAVVAEGVESPRHLDELRRLGCDSGQGYWIARPQAPEVVEAVLDAPAALFEFAPAGGRGRRPAGAPA